MMNVLYTESSSNIGGQELQAVAQMIALFKAGHRVILACSEHSRISAEARRYDIPVVHISFRNSLHIPSILALRRLIVAFRPEMVVCHSDHDSNIAGITRRILFGSSSRFVILRQKTYMTRNMKMFSLNHMCDVVMVPSEEMRSCLLHKMCRQSVVVVPLGMNLTALRKQTDEALPEHINAWLKKRTPAPVIVQVGMIRPGKGHHFILEVLHRLKQRGVHFYWFIVGGGRREEEARLQAEIEYMEMDDCVLMCGLLFPVAPLYGIASLMVMPSRNEVFDIALVEATVCGVPVMASQVGSTVSIIHHGYSGILLPPDDRIAWENALASFFDSSESVQAIVLRGQKEIDGHYSIDSTVRKLMALGMRYRNIR
ncbi:glycosyltransferase family 4 protein [Escherichia coli]